ncbi:MULTISPECIES: hypothetical protein [Hyphobacterium]|uniref:Uncharacterized protein n=1 Tax=Hyphobacterium vulgare TaxID=1736751 RepID=A0ABV6ZV17_9PROT
MRAVLIAGLFVCSVLLFGVAVAGSVVTLSGSAEASQRETTVDWFLQFVRIAIAFEIPLLSIAFWAGIVSAIAAMTSLRFANGLPYEN